MKDLEQQYLIRASEKLEEAVDVIGKAQPAIFDCVSKVDGLSPQDMLALQNIDLSQQIVKCVSDFLKAVVDGNPQPGNLRPNDIAEFLCFGTGEEPSEDNDCLF